MADSSQKPGADPDAQAAPLKKADWGTKLPAWFLATSLLILSCLLAVVALATYNGHPLFHALGGEWGFGEKPSSWRYVTQDYKPDRAGTTDMKPLPVSPQKGFCFLTSVTGMAGAGESVSVDNNSGNLAIHSGNSEFKASVGCIEFSAKKSMSD